MTSVNLPLFPWGAAGGSSPVLTNSDMQRPKGPEGEGQPLKSISPSGRVAGGCCVCEYRPIYHLLWLQKALRLLLLLKPAHSSSEHSSKSLVPKRLGENAPQGHSLWGRDAFRHAHLRCGRFHPTPEAWGTPGCEGWAAAAPILSEDISVSPGMGVGRDEGK